MLQFSIVKRKKSYLSKFSVFILIIMLILSTSGISFAATESEVLPTDEVVESSEKVVTINVTLEGLVWGGTPDITLVKEGDEPINKTIEDVVDTATFRVPPGEVCIITGEDVPGYVTPEPVEVTLSGFSGNFTKDATLTYVYAGDSDPYLELDPAQLEMFVSETQKLVASVFPTNDDTMAIAWASSDETVLEVDDAGNLTAMAAGAATVTVTVTGDVLGTLTENCEVTVYDLPDIPELDVIYAKTGALVNLPEQIELNIQNVPNAKLSKNIIWKDAKVINGKQSVRFLEADTFVVEGTIAGLNELVYQTVIVEDALDEDGDIILLDKFYISLLGPNPDLPPDSETISVVSTTLDEGIGGLNWENSDEKVIELTETDDPGTYLITALKVGSSIITVSDSTGTVTADVFVSVSLDPNIIEDVYIKATTIDSEESVDQFEDRESVYIRGYGLKPETQYFILVSAMDHDSELGRGSITTGPAPEGALVVDTMFPLYENAEFGLTDKNSNSYVVKLSTYGNFPTGDDDDGPRTLTDNFKIYSPIPTGEIKVSFKQLIGGNLELIDADLVGSDVILGREMGDYSATDTTYSMYISEYYDPSDVSTKYSDEAKLIGHLDKYGDVVWDVPAESLKIGGYVLLAELDLGYISNLNELNIESEDGEILKEVHIIRGETIVRPLNVMKTNILDKYIIKMDVGTSEQLSIITENPEVDCYNFRFRSRNTSTAAIELIPVENTDDEVELFKVNILGLSPGETVVELVDDDENVIAICYVEVYGSVIGLDDVANVYTNTTGTAIEVLVNDIGSPDDVLTVESVSNLPGLELEDGVITYAPPTDFIGTKTFTYIVTNSVDSVDMATVTIYVFKPSESNTPPVAADDEHTVDENSGQVKIDVLANDSDVDANDSIRVISVTPLAGLSLENGEVYYEPPVDYYGQETFDYTIMDDYGGMATATVSITVNNLNLPPLAVDDQITVDENSDVTILDVLTNDSDPNGDDLSIATITSLTGLALNQGVLTYQPEANFYGVKTFDYTISDGRAVSEPATVTITVKEVVDTSTSRSSSTRRVVTIKLDLDPVELEYGSDALPENLSYDLTETITGTVNKSVIWSIEDETIATVDQEGLVTAVSQGETTVTVEHKNSGKTATATVIVYLVGDEVNPLGAVEFFDPYVHGYPDGSFGPTRMVTRAEVATMFSKILKLNTSYTGSQRFNDVDDGDWYYKYVQAMVRARLFVGDGSGNFRPNDPITRAEIAAVFGKYWEFLNIDVDDTQVSDVNDVNGSHWAHKYIHMMYNSNVVSGFEDGTYRPDEATLREQIVVMINALIGRPAYQANSSKFNDVLNSHWAYGNIEAASQVYEKKNKGLNQPNN